jgi:hypothetical protein
MLYHFYGLFVLRIHILFEDSSLCFSFQQVQLQYDVFNLQLPFVLQVKHHDELGFLFTFIACSSTIDFSYSLGCRRGQLPCLNFILFFLFPAS